MSNKQYTMTLFEACEFLSVGKRTVSRLVKDKKITPQKERTPQGLWAYKFNKDDLIKHRENKKLGVDTPLSDTIGHDTTGQDTPKDMPKQETPSTQTEEKPVIVKDKTDDKTRQDRGHDTTRHDEIIGILKQDKRELKDDLRAEKKSHTKNLQAKDQQIHHLISSHETQMERKDILLKGLQDRILTLDAPSKQGQGSEQIERENILAEEIQTENTKNTKPVKTANNKTKRSYKTKAKTIKEKKRVNNNGNKVKDKTRQDTPRQDKPAKKGLFKKIFG